MRMKDHLNVKKLPVKYVHDMLNIFGQVFYNVIKPIGKLI